MVHDADICRTAKLVVEGQATMQAIGSRRVSVSSPALGRYPEETPDNFRGLPMMVRNRYRIVREKDGTFTLEVTLGIDAQEPNVGFRGPSEAADWAVGMQAASADPSLWERLPDADRK